MELISKTEDWVKDLYPETIFDNNYKLSEYCIIEECEDGYILFHTITWTILLLTNEEFENVLSNEFLLENKIVINKALDESIIAEKAFLKRTTADCDKTYEHVNGYVIITTNECNARCPYCYESLKNGRMNKETADDLISFIESHHTGPLNITWFGGEPFLNSDIMDYICDELNERKIRFSTSIISNLTYLPKNATFKIGNNWAIKSIATTIDGPEEYYNKIKNTPSIENPFKRVIENIKTILDETIADFSIRINVSNENIDLMDETIKSIKTELKDFEGRYSIYFSEIYQVLNDENTLKKDDFMDKYFDVQNKYSTNEKVNVITKKNLVHCMTDNCSTVVVMPNGDLHNCEHMCDKNLIGNLKEGIIYDEVIKAATTKDGPNIEFCNSINCKLLPICEHYYFCDTEGICKTKKMQSIKLHLLKRKLKTTYEYYKTKKGGE